MKKIQLSIITGLAIFFVIAVIFILSRFSRIVSFLESMDGEKEIIRTSFVAGIEYGVAIAVQICFIAFLIFLFLKTQRSVKK